MLTAFRIFVDLVDAGSFSRAAEKNYLTPSAVSQRIKQLEETLGHPLVERARSGATPTEAGGILYRACRDILARYADLERELDGFREEIGGRLRLGAVTSIGLHGLAPTLKTYLERHPAVDVALEYMTSQDVYRGILERELDLGIVAFPHQNPAIVITPFRRDELVAIVAPGHRLARATAIDPRRLAGEPFVAFERQIPTGRVILRLLQRRRVRVRIVHRFDNVETVKRAVEIGAGVAIVPAETVDLEVEAGALRRMSLRGRDWWRPIAVLHRKDRTPGLAARAFMDVLKG